MNTQALADIQLPPDITLRASDATDFRCSDDRIGTVVGFHRAVLQPRCEVPSRSGIGRDRAERAARELLAVQSSDWAFLDNRKQAGDYPFDRAVDHAGQAFDALQSGTDEHHVPLDSRVRSLAPDLSLTPLLIP